MDRSIMRYRIWIAAGAMMALVSCESPDETRVVSAGEWGGQNADLLVSASGATARFKCGATGVVSEALTVDASGNFDVPGTYETPVVQVGAPPFFQVSPGQVSLPGSPGPGIVKVVQRSAPLLAS